MSSNEESLVLACSVRHWCASSWVLRSSGTDVIHLLDMSNARVEIIIKGEVWSATGAELVKDDEMIVVRWWFSGGHQVSYALLVHASGERPIEGDHFIDLDSASGTCKELDFERWRFRSQW